MLNPNLISRLPKPISCRLLAPSLTRYVEAAHSLSPGERKAVADHLQGCPACAEETETIQMMGSLLQDRAPAILPVTVPSADLWDRIEARIVAEEVPAQPVRSKKNLGPALVFAPAFAALIVAAVVVPKVMHHDAPADGKSASVLAQAPAGPAMVASQESEEQKPAMEMVTRSRKIAAPVAPSSDTAADAPAARGTIAPAAVPAPALAFADKAAPAPRVSTQNAQPLAKRAQVRKPTTQVAMQPRSRPSFSAGRAVAPPMRRQREATRYVAIEIVPVPSPTPRVQTQVAINNAGRHGAAIRKAGTPAADYPDMPFRNSHAYEIDADARASDKVAAAPSAVYVAPVLPAPRAGEPVLPGVPAGIASRTITVVGTDPGSGVPESAKKFPAPANSVTETLIRSRQRRGLFGGYGAGMTAMMPSGIAPKKSEASEPW